LYWVLLPTKTHNGTRSSVVYPQARAPFLLLKTASEHAHVRLLPRLSWSWTLSTTSLLAPLYYASNMRWKGRIVEVFTMQFSIFRCQVLSSRSDIVYYEIAIIFVVLREEFLSLLHSFMNSLKRKRYVASNNTQTCPQTMSWHNWKLRSRRSCYSLGLRKTMETIIRLVDPPLDV
jgi:hypothetical protein